MRTKWVNSPECQLDQRRQQQKASGKQHNFSLFQPLAWKMRSLLVGSHNIMHGLFLPELLPAYARLHRERGVGALCLQECSHSAASAVARALGPRFAAAWHPVARGLAVVYDRTRLVPRRRSAIGLPRLTRVPRWQWAYTSKTPEQRWALAVRFAPRCAAGHAAGRCSATLVSFHLDAAGDLAHRTRQMRALSHALTSEARATPLQDHCGHSAGAALWLSRDLLTPRRARPQVPLSAPLVACGDTNAFTLLRKAAEPALAALLQPLVHRHRARDAALAAGPARPADTHHFARAREPKLGHRLAVAAGLRKAAQRPAPAEAHAEAALAAARDRCAWGRLASPVRRDLHRTVHRPPSRSRRHSRVRSPAGVG